MEEMKCRDVVHFKSLLDDAPQSRLSIDVHFEKMVSPKLNSWLCMYPQEEEVCHALFSLPTRKSPGPDRIPVDFYKLYWSTVKFDFLAMILYFFQFKYILKSQNQTFITLIPKKESSTNLGDYQLINDTLSK